MIRPPSGKKVTENLLKETVAKLDPATLSKEALDITLPYATEVLLLSVCSPLSVLFSLCPPFLCVSSLCVSLVSLSQFSVC